MPQPAPKKLYATGVAHPAPFSDAILPELAAMLDGRHRLVLDPFAGVGRIHEIVGLVSWDMDTVGVELEPEWAGLHSRTCIGSVLALPFADDSFDAVVTSPAYGNRLADHHRARDGSVRRSYTHDIGHPLHEDNSGAMQWGERYRQFHVAAWEECRRSLRPGGRLVLNVSDHIRGGARQYVSSWHVGTLIRLGFELADALHVATPRLRQGSNREARVNFELVLAFDLSN